MVAMIFFDVTLKDAVKLGIFEGSDQQMIFGRDAAVFARVGMHDQSGEPIRFVTEEDGKERE